MKQQNEPVYKITLTNSEGWTGTYQATKEDKDTLINTFIADHEQEGIEYFITIEEIR